MAWAGSSFDDPVARRADVFTPAVFADLRAALAALAGQPVKAVVVMSAKERIFIAEADSEIGSLETAECWRRPPQWGERGSRRSGYSRVQGAG